MLKRIPVKVVYSSATDKKVENIEHFDPNGGGGWTTDIFCEWPQTLILELNSGLPVTVNELQVMSHEEQIPMRVEILATVSSTANAMWTDYHSLGFFSFTDNTKSSLKAREVKTINLNVRCSLLMLRIHGCHMNSLNLFNQVTITGLSVLGDWVQESLTEKGYIAPVLPASENPDVTHTFVHSFHTPVKTSLSGNSKIREFDDDNKLSSSPSQRNRSKHRSTIDYQFSRSNRLSPKNSKSPKSLANAVAVDDLEFDMKFDSESAVLIRECQSAKLYYAEKDDFEKAAIFKEIEDQLKDIGMKIASLETRKATAIVADDFKNAKRWNDEIDQLRIVAHDKLENAPDIFKFRQVFSAGKNNNVNSSSSKEGEGGKELFPTNALLSEDQQLNFKK